MKKSYNPISDVNNEKNELTKRIYRTLSDVVRQLDDVRGRSQTISDLFLPYLATLRVKLHELCYKLILTDPLGYGKKGEELLWRKGYHDVFTTAKRLRKNDTWSPSDIAYIQGLLISGIGHYKHLLFKLQTDYKLDIQGVVDFSLTICDLGLPKAKSSSAQQKTPEKNVVDWAKESCQRCLIYLGDLNRYLLDLYPLWDSGTAERYYMQAATLNTICGRPHNQLGTLSGSKNYHLDAVYHYMRCMMCAEPFQGSEGNLKKTLEKNAEFMQLEPFLPNPAPAVQKTITKFLFLFDVWFFEKTVERDLHVSCHEMLQELQVCLNEENVNSFPIDVNELELSNLTPFRNRSVVQPICLDSDMMLKMVLLVLFCVDKLQKKDSAHTSAVIAMCLAIFSQILQQLNSRFQQFYSKYTNAEIFSTESSKSLTSSNDSNRVETKTEKLKKKNKFDRNTKNHENERNGRSYNRNMKYSEKKRNKGKRNDEAINNGDNEFSDAAIEDEQKEKAKKKSRLKRRKRIRQTSLSDSELSDSDISLNDSSTENEYPTENSESEEVVTSDGEELDETLLIIDQKIKEKNKKDENKNNVEEKNDSEVNSQKKIINVSELEKEMLKNGIVEQNGLKLNEKDKTKSLFTIANGVIDDKKVVKNSGGDCENIVGNVPNGNASETASNENNERGDANKEIESRDSSFVLPQIDSKEMFQFLSKQGLLQSVKVCCDWLKTDSETMKACSKSSKTLLGKLVVFLNLIAIKEDSLWKDVKKTRENGESIPLSEDVMTRGLNMLRGGHEKLDWDFHRTNNVNSREENLLRLSRLLEFGHYLTKFEETGILYNKESRVFYIAGQNGKVADASNDSPDEKHSNNASRKGQLMKNMGKLWLKAEVRDLESRVRRRAGNFSPYLVVDSEALIEHIVLVKQLVGSRQFIVIIPAVVLSHLDECKRDSGRARETIRWLESQFQHGNRSLRAQKSQERFSLPFIKYPKKKDKEAWNFFQIVECCHYFSKQSEFQNCSSNLLVTLLTGQKDVSFIGDNKKEDFGKDYSPMGVAKNFGINLEHIETFHTKWKLSTKSHG